MIQIITRLFNKKNLSKTLLACSLLFVFVISIWGLWNHYSIGIWGDEFGYWQAGAFFLNKDWSSVASMNGYYGYGFGILLAPILWLFNSDSVVMYQAALVMESLMLTSCTAAGYLCLKKLGIGKNDITKVIISVASVLYPSNILWVKTTLSEIMLIFLGWWIFYLILCFHEKRKLSQAIGLVVMSVYAYAVHQRALAILITVMLMIILAYGKKIFSRKYLAVIVLLVILLILAAAVKNIYIKKVYTTADAEYLGGNGMSGMKQILFFVLSSWNGFSQFVLSVIGKFYYIFAASYLFVFYGMSSCISKSINDVRSKVSIANSIPYLYLLFSFLLAMAVGALYMSSGFQNRTDILIYGRYAEYTVGPLILVGLANVFEKPKRMLKQTCICIIIVALSALLVQTIIPLEATNANIWLNCTGISDFIYEKEYGPDIAILLAFKRSVLASLVLLFLLNGRTRIRKVLSHVWLTGIVCVWIYTAFYVWNTAGIPWRNSFYRQQREIVSTVASQEIYIYQCTFGAFFQFLEPNSKVINIKTLEELERIGYDGGVPVITDIYAEDAEYIRKNYEITKENERHFVWNYVE